MYLRIDWADVQPAPDVFDWSEIDRVMEHWGKLGYRFSFRVCCNETWPIQCFAAPKWLYDMGCGGGFYQRDSNGSQQVPPGKGNWEPDYGDPLFLKYLNRFLEKFSEKFDADPRIEYIDIGSYGNWGEGHTYFGSRKCFGLDVLKKHVYLHALHFKHTPLLVNDDFLTQLYGCPQEDLLQLQDLCCSMGFGLRDDSVLVGSWDYRAYHNVEYPQLFDRFTKNAPADLELAHYTHYTREQAKGGLRAIEAARRCRATFMGFHGYPDQWLTENYYVTEYLANRLGYWYFLRAVSHNDIVRAGAPAMVELEWENAGFAPCYVRYQLELKYTHTVTGQQYIYPQPCFDNRLWQENSCCIQRYFPALDSEMEEGMYALSVRICEPAPILTPIRLALKSACMDSEGFYEISSLTVLKA